MNSLLMTLIAIISIGTTTVAAAHKQDSDKPEAIKSETLTLRGGSQRKVARGELTIKFVSVLEDSRCPVGVNCITAGNAKIQVKVTDRRGRSKLVELNTNREPRGDKFGKYRINFVNLSPEPKQGGQPPLSHYTARLSIQRLSS